MNSSTMDSLIITLESIVTSMETLSGVEDEVQVEEIASSCLRLQGLIEDYYNKSCESVRRIYYLETPEYPELN